MGEFDALRGLLPVELIARLEQEVEEPDPPGGGGGTQMFSFDANMATFPASAPAAATSRNEHPLIAYDATIAEKVVFHGVMSNDYQSGSNLLIDIDWVADTAVIDGVTWGVEIEAIATGGHDIDADSFATQKIGTSTTSGTVGIVTTTTITLTNAEADTIAASDAFRLRVERVTGDSGDDMLGDAQLLRVQARQ